MKAGIYTHINEDFRKEITKIQEQTQMSASDFLKFAMIDEIIKLESIFNNDKDQDFIDIMKNEFNLALNKYQERLQKQKNKR